MDDVFLRFFFHACVCFVLYAELLFIEMDLV